MKAVQDVPNKILQSKLSRKNILTFLCLVENIVMSWMRNEKEETVEENQESASIDSSFGKVNEHGVYLVTGKESQRVVKRFDTQRTRRQK